MNKNKLFFLGACLFLLIGCTINNKGKSETNTSSSENQSSESVPSSESQTSSETSESESESETSSSEERDPLAAPVLRLNDTKDGVTWDAVEGATQYTVCWDDTTFAQEFPVDDLNAAFASTTGNHSIYVIACADEEQYNSQPSEKFNYSTKAAYLSSITYNEGAVTWGDYDGVNMMVKEVRQETFSVIEGNSYPITKGGFYIFQATTGYDEDNNTYYVKSGAVSNERGILVGDPATTPYVLEDGSEDDNATLQEQWEVTKWVDGSGWATSTAVMSLDADNEKISPNKCVKIQYWHHGVWFKFNREITLDKSYDTISFYAKGDGSEQFMVSFEIDEHIVVGGIDLIGVYITYLINPLPAQWKHYSISMNDPKWQIAYGNDKLSFSEVKQLLGMFGCEINSLGDLMPYFNTFQVRTKADYDNNGSKAYAWFDEMMLSNTGAETAITIPFVIYDDYAFSSDAFNGTIHFEDSVASISTTYLGSPVEVEGAYEGTDTGGLKLTVNQPGFETVAILETNDGGNTFTMVSIEGAGATYFNNIALARYAPADNFNSYSATGVGYDNTHGVDERSGLRGQYYCDFYNTGTQTQQQSPMGGDNWYLMGSTDYLNLVDAGRNGSKAARLKYSGYSPMRYITYGLSDGTAEPIGKGEKFSFWIKGSTNRQITIKVRVYSSGAKLTPSTQQNNSTLDTIVVPQNSDWTEYTISLNKSSTIYGYSFILQTNWDEVSDYIYLDDVSIYSSISPWENA